MISQVNPLLGDEECEALSGVVKRNWLTEGPETSAFLERIRTLMNVKHAFPVNNGTLALYVSLLAANLPRGSEVIVPAFTFFGSVSAIHFAGLVPRIVDVDPHTLMLSTRIVEEAINPNTSAVMPVHIYGRQLDLSGIISLAKKNELFVIEDAAQGVGVVNGMHCGTNGDVGTFSFFADKTITMGEGGIIVTDNDDYAERIRLLRNQGRPNSGTFVHPSFGMNFRITDLQAAVGLQQLGRLDYISSEKVKKFEIYQAYFDQFREVLKTPKISSKEHHIPFRYYIRSRKKLEIKRALEANEIQTREFFFPMSEQPAVLNVYGEQRPCPNAKEAFEEGLCLPIHEKIGEEEISKMADIISSVV